MGKSMNNCAITVPECVITETRRDAEWFVDAIRTIIAEKGKATVRDLNDLCWLCCRLASGTWPSDSEELMKFGWTSIDDWRTTRTYEGYCITFPKPVCLD